MLSQLLKAELAEREVRSIAYHMKSARFPAYKDLSGFDFAASEINEATVRTLHRCEFMDGAQNVVLIGGPGTGKTHVATALGIQAIEHHRRKVAPLRANKSETFDCLKFTLGGAGERSDGNARTSAHAVACRA